MCLTTIIALQRFAKSLVWLILLSVKKWGENMTYQWDKEVDIIVVGSGAGGMVSALAAVQNQADVMIIERPSCGAAHQLHQVVAFGCRAAMLPKRQVLMMI